MGSNSPGIQDDHYIDQVWSDSSSPSSTTSSTSLTAIHKLDFGAYPMKLKRKEYVCSKSCKRKNQTAFKDAQAVEKHILRDHPDPTYNTFVCIWCDKSKTSPQQILDHLGQAVASGGHAITDQFAKNESVKALHRETKELFGVKRAKKEFAWYICLPPVPSTEDSKSPSPEQNVSESQENETTGEASISQAGSSNESNQSYPLYATLGNNVNIISSSALQNKPPGRPPDNTITDMMMITDRFSALPG